MQGFVEYNDHGSSMFLFNLRGYTLLFGLIAMITVSSMFLFNSRGASFCSGWGFVQLRLS